MQLQEMEIRTKDLNLCMMKLIKGGDGITYIEYKQKQGRTERMPLQYLLDQVSRFERLTS